MKTTPPTTTQTVVSQATALRRETFGLLYCLKQIEAGAVPDEDGRRAIHEAVESIASHETGVPALLQRLTLVNMVESLGTAPSAKTTQTAVRDG